MTDIHTGALPYQDIEQLVASGHLGNVQQEQIAPASLDLTISDEVYRVSGTFLTRPGDTVRQALEAVGNEKHDLANPMERDVTYVARVNETVALPKNMYGYCNPKSSTGRVNVHARVLADGVPRYDSLTPSGWEGELWMSMIPKSFPVRVEAGEALAQLRLFTKDTRLDEKGLEKHLAEDKLLWTHKGRVLEYDDIKISDRDGSVLLTLDLSNNFAGWESVEGNTILDLAKRDHYQPETFFRPLHVVDDSLLLKKGGFYILSTNEYVRVPSTMACEMAPMDERSGDFRSHRAGFIDPGWGWGKSGEGEGRPLTLEVEPFEDLIVYHKQPIARITFERLTSEPTVLYDTKGTSNYGNQMEARLSKHFTKAA